MTSQSTHVVFGAGALGREVARQLVGEGARVRLVSRSGSTSLQGVEPVATDLTNPASAVTAALGADVLYFCAAPPYQEWTRSFMVLQEGAIAAARQTGAILVAAENLYGYGVAGELTESMPLKATTKKGAVRACMSHRLFEAHHGGEIRAVSGRASDFFGPGVTQSAVGDRFWPDLLKERRINWFGDPDVLHSFTYLPDFARALIVLGRRSDTWGRAWHVPSLEPLSIRALAERAAQIGGIARPRIRRTPRFVLRLVGLVLPAASELIEMEYAFDRDFILSQDNWDANFDLRATDLNAALAETIDAWRREARYDGG